VRFLLAGAVNTVFGYSVFFLMLLVPAPLWLQLLAANVVAVTFNYVTAARFVFRHGGWRPILRFVAVYVVLYGVNLVAMQALLDRGWQPMWAAVAVLPPVTVLTFFCQRWFVFGRRG
jgi:putative flippase GtrA